MNTLTQTLLWLAHPVSLPAWAVAIGAFCTFAAACSLIFMLWMLKFSREMEIEAEHD